LRPGEAEESGSRLEDDCSRFFEELGVAIAADATTGGKDGRKSLATRT
jgi:hypothetical protein